MTHTLPWSLVLALCTTLTCVGAHAASLYDEQSSGDLNHSQAVTVSTSGSVSGTISAAVKFNPNYAFEAVESDGFTLIIPAGKQLTSITVDYFGTATVGNVRFGVGFFVVDADFAGGYIEDSLDGTFQGQASLFASSGQLPLTHGGSPSTFGIGFGSPRFVGSMPVGTVGLAYHYTLNFAVQDAPVSNVPEPAAAGPMLAGLGLLGALQFARQARRRRIDGIPTELP